jgi:hypothetical protein
MTLKNYLMVMSVLTAFGWVIFFAVAKLVDPNATNIIGFFLFYLALFVALAGTIALVGFLIRAVGRKESPAFNLVKMAFRQSFLFAIFIIILLILKSQGLFNWLNLFLLVIIFAILELFLIKRPNHR